MKCCLEWSTSFQHFLCLARYFFKEVTFQCESLIVMYVFPSWRVISLLKEGGGCHCTFPLELIRGEFWEKITLSWTPLYQRWKPQISFICSWCWIWSSNLWLFFSFKIYLFFFIFNPGIEFKINMSDWFTNVIQMYMINNKIYKFEYSKL